MEDVIRSWVGYTGWILGLCLLLGIEHMIQQRVSQIATQTFQGEMPIWTDSLLPFVLGLYVATIFVWRRALHMNKKLFIGAFIPLFLLSGYPLVAILAHWMIPFVMTYMTIYPVLPTLAGLIFMMSLFDVKAPRGG